jgi:hypothetical protein
MSAYLPLDNYLDSMSDSVIINGQCFIEQNLQIQLLEDDDDLFLAILVIRRSIIC